MIVPEGKIATGKLAQALMHGAQVIALRGNFDQALELVRELATKHPIALVNSVNPFRLEGQKTAAFEIARGDRADRRALHPGRQRRQHHRVLEGLHGVRARRREMHGFQAAGAAPLVTGERVEHPETVASAIRIGNPARWEEAMTAMRDSRGGVGPSPTSRSSTPTAARRARGRLLRAGQRRVRRRPAHARVVGTRRRRGRRVVCVLTGHGLKDPQTALEQAGSVVPCEPEIGAVETAVLG